MIVPAKKSCQRCTNTSIERATSKIGGLGFRVEGTICRVPFEGSPKQGLYYFARLDWGSPGIEITN